MTDVTAASPFTLHNKNVTFKNRFVKSAMSEGLASSVHLPGADIFRLYYTWAKGGAGLLITGNVMINQQALGEPGNVVLESEKQLGLFRAWARAGTHNNTHLWMQINHPGKQVPKGVAREAVAPSAVPFESGIQRFFPDARALTPPEIETIIRQFARTASLAKRAGFTGVQIHAAHGYLISQFLSPRHNQRTDEWGGSIKNRFRFLRKIFNAVREATGPEFPVGVKINSADFMKAGFSEEESQYVIKELERLGVDMIEISGGTYERPELFGKNASASTLRREAYFLEYAESLKQTTEVPVILTGGFRTRTAMDNALQSGAADFIGLARPMAACPDYPARLLSKAPVPRIAPVKTGLPFIDNLGIMELAWYNQQLARLSKGRKAAPGLPPVLSLGILLMKNGLNVIRQRRG
ncbi:NADH:flavin oxidoreductase/NADH oxidase family protein [Marinococcus luteus]|uniref:NADH:flavin oxidoreductase/NADH oxidase family protein n=1 Tax=Marinococcus luteus TaxID=1122204 RepID=UPI002ACC7E90|nr:NADH:flavin oxidoreductase/NADH oxidase family protein [Marinococcus luteus]MDZ5782642.1 NADH:flavin oxidoreductase/NADH oxidase family protein [Marinococcus luteus]